MEDNIGIVSAEFEADGKVNILISVRDETLRLTLDETRNLENSLFKLLDKVDDVLDPSNRE